MVAVTSAGAKLLKFAEPGTETHDIRFATLDQQRILRPATRTKRALAGILDSVAFPVLPPTSDRSVTFPRWVTSHRPAVRPF
jgi:hypothetical protein